MEELGGKIDINDYNHFVRLFGEKPVAALPCPIGKEKEINPQATRFFWKNGQMTDVFHVKPIYYETLTGEWRPMSEIASGFGNRWINLKPEWANLAHPRYIQWLMGRMDSIKGSVNFPFSLPLPVFATDFFPAAGANSPVDGWARRVNNATWVDAHDTADGEVANDTGGVFIIEATREGNGTFTIYRSIASFNTAAIGSDSISAAILSLAGSGDAAQNGSTTDLDVVSASLISNAAVAVGDYDGLGTTVFASKALSAWVSTIGTYNDLTLDSNGEANINTSGISNFGLRIARDTDNAAPTTNGHENQAVSLSADEAGTDKDPKLTVTHAAAGGASKMLMGIGS